LPGNAARRGEIFFAIEASSLLGLV
jgi:hypothetical protein